jgi:hypothetical protein
MRSVRISLKTARALRELGYRPGHVTNEQLRALQDLESAMEPKRSVKAATGRRVAKRATKKAETSDIRHAVMKRAKGLCEYCGTLGSAYNPLTLEHMFGRVRAPQSVENCWALCLDCHRRKTDGRPHSRFWFEMFSAHCRLHGYEEQAARALKDGNWRQAKKDADEARAASVTRGAP